jgi:hypothetical protein
VSDQFVFVNHLYLLILSDYQGEVLAIQRLSSKGPHELQIPERDDGVYHATIFDGKNSFQTYAGINPDDYFIDFPRNSSGNASVGKHSVFFKDPSITNRIASTSNLAYSTYISNEQLDLNLSEPVSDLYIYFKKNNEFRYLYYPDISVGQSTTVDASSFSQGEKPERLPIDLTDADNLTTISFGASGEVNGKRIGYFLSETGPFETESAYVNIPTVLVSKFSTFSTMFQTGTGSQYLYVGPTPASKFKKFEFSADNVSANSESIFYSIAGDATYVNWNASGTNCSWSVFSNMGTNVRINLPKLPSEITVGYGLNTLNTLRFSEALLHKDTRFSSYSDFIKSKMSEEVPDYSPSYEKFNQYIPVTR